MSLSDRRLSRSRLADDDERLARKRGERNVLEDRAVERQVDALELDDRAAQRARVFGPRTLLAGVVFRQLTLDCRPNALFLLAPDDVVRAPVARFGYAHRVLGRFGARRRMRIRRRSAVAIDHGATSTESRICVRK